MAARRHSRRVAVCPSFLRVREGSPIISRSQARQARQRESPCPWRLAVLRRWTAPDRYGPRAWESYLLCRPRGRSRAARGTFALGGTRLPLTTNRLARMSVDRDEISALLQAHGEHLRRAAAISAEHHAAVARLLPAAIEAGLSKREI